MRDAEAESRKDHDHHPVAMQEKPIEFYSSQNKNPLKPLNLLHYSCYCWRRRQKANKNRQAK